MRTDLHHWLALWQSLALDGSVAAAWHDKLLAAYQEPTRHYHNLQHLTECLSLLDEAALSEPGLPSPVIEMALWFHDAIYDAQASDNEVRSAALAAEALKAGKAEASLMAHVERLILATQRHHDDGQPGTAWLLDIDLAILGQSPERFAEYEQGIRAEYAWVPEALYRTKRAEVLDGFLKRPALYMTESFQARFEAKARGNLASSILQLTASEPSAP